MTVKPLKVQMYRALTWSAAFAVLEALEKTGNARTEKIAALKKGAGNPALVQILRWTYSGDKYFTFPSGTGTKKIAKGFDLRLTMVEFARLLENLRTRTLSGDAARDAVEQFFTTIPRCYGRWLVRAMHHDLRCNAKKNTITAALGEDVWADNAVETRKGEETRYLGCSLAHNYKGWNPKWETRRVEPKLDGFRLTASVGTKSVTFYTRGGKHEPHTTNLKHVGKMLLKLGFRRCLVDGEIMVGDRWNTVALTKHKRPTDAVKKLLREQAVFHVFDFVPLTKDGREPSDPKMPFSARRAALYKFLKGNKVACVQLVKQYKVRGPVGVQKLYDQALEDGYEGVMVKDPDAPYAFKRSNACLKVKPTVEVDARVVGYVEGKGKHEGRLGALKCEKEDGTPVRVGAGWSDKVREQLWKKRKSLIGHWLEALEQAAGKKIIKANHPRFRRWRPDRDKA